MLEVNRILGAEVGPFNLGKKIMDRMVSNVGGGNCSLFVEG